MSVSVSVLPTSITLAGGVTIKKEIHLDGL